MTHDLSRRTLLKRSAAALGVAAMAPLAAAPALADDAAPFPISLNTSTLRGHKLPITRTVAIAAAAGYQGIEPWPDELQRFVQSGGKLRDLRKQLTDSGLRVTGAISFFRWMVDDDAQRAKGLEDAKHTLEQLAAIGATHVAAAPAGDIRGVSLLAIAERYRKLLELSESFGVIPAVEIWGSRDGFNRLGQAVLVALEANHPKACVLPDVYHLYKGGSGLAGIPLLGAKMLGGFHLNDYPADPPRETIRDQHRVYPGDGIAPLTKLFHDLRAIGYRGPLSIELFNREYYKQDPELVAKTAIAKTRAVMQKAFG